MDPPLSGDSETQSEKLSYTSANPIVTATPQETPKSSISDAYQPQLNTTGLPNKGFRYSIENTACPVERPMLSGELDMYVTPTPFSKAKDALFPFKNIPKRKQCLDVYPAKDYVVYYYVHALSEKNISVT